MEILSGIHQADGVNATCCIIARDGLTVIDTGLPGSGKKILAYITDRLHRRPKEITTILLTHFHLDHTGGLPALRKAAPAARIAIGEGDAGYVSGSVPLPWYPGFRGILLRAANGILGPGPFRPDILLHDGDRQDGLLCVHLPGHTPGSFGFLEEQSGVLVSGDILRSDGNGIARGPVRFTMEPEQEIRSIRKIAGLEFEILLPGHGVPLRPGASGKVREFARLLPGDSPAGSKEKEQ